MPAELINDTGCGNTLAAERAPVVRLILDSLRYFAVEAGVDGFRFDLAVTAARTAAGFSPDAPVLAAIAQDPVLRDLTLIAEPWDVGPGGYQLGHFPPSWHEWNDTYRDDVRRFWRGDAGAAGAFATRISGSADIFQRPGRTPAAGINFAAAHDGFSLRDCVSYEHRHNHANGENNRDGHGANHSWNCGHEGETPDTDTVRQRQRDIRAMMATLFLSRGTPMLTAGDEFGRTQGGNNNAYAQDNALTWIDWVGADSELLAFTQKLAAFREEWLAPRFIGFLEGEHAKVGNMSLPDVCWTRPDGRPMNTSDWHDTDQVCMTLTLQDCLAASRLHIAFNRAKDAVAIVLPPPLARSHWRQVLDSAGSQTAAIDDAAGQAVNLPGRCVRVFAEILFA